MSGELKEKTVLPTAAVAAGHLATASRTHGTSWSSRLLALLSLWYGRHGWDHHSIQDLCPQAERLNNTKYIEFNAQLSNIIDSEAYQQRAIDWLSGAVQIPTESYDQMDPVGVDPRWEVFGPFHDYLLQAYPLIHATLKLSKVNTYGLVYHWQGVNKDLKPLLLTAHQDVVPVDPKTVDQWVHPPYSGYFDGTYIWGRGSSDDKSGLISIMSAVETMLENKFAPQRSIVLAFGFDEETSGEQGAMMISEYLLQTYGENAFSMLVDEGGSFAEVYGAIVATPGVGEKGYIDVAIEVNTPGGHSSVPPPHTGIGILASFLVALESKPIVPHIGRTTPTYKTLQCIAAHTPDIPKKLKKDIIRSVKSDRALRRVEDALTPELRALVGTTQAIDLIAGGVKTNALPEQSTAVVNHRIATDSSVDAVKERVTAVLAPLASKHNLSLTSFGIDMTSSEGAYGSLKLTDAFGTALEPAPVSPIGPQDGPWAVLSATITANLLESEYGAKKIVVAPGIMSGNTRYYWGLTPHIFRYSHHGPDDAYGGGGIHTVNEATAIKGILRQIKFFTLLILNTDESSTI
ncbi:carboxypeptidase S [Hysterangium stoloniferum]|nr:carboxypeptidase S [Hysterangium stoloniferum]